MTHERGAGFTLIELVVAIVLLGISLGAVSSMFIAVRNIQTQDSYYDIADRAAGFEIESLRNEGYSSLTAGQNIDFTSSLPASLPNGQATAVISTPMTGLRRVDASVTYTANGATRTVTLSSLIGEIGITQ